MPLGRGGGVNRVGLSPVSLALWEPQLHLRSHGKIGDCEQSKTCLTLCSLVESDVRSIVNGFC